MDELRISTDCFLHLFIIIALGIQFGLLKNVTEQRM